MLLLSPVNRSHLHDDDDGVAINDGNDDTGDRLILHVERPVNLECLVRAKGKPTNHKLKFDLQLKILDNFCIKMHSTL